jgi:hypothetical protein
MSDDNTVYKKVNGKYVPIGMHELCYTPGVYFVYSADRRDGAKSFQSFKADKLSSMPPPLVSAQWQQRVDLIATCMAEYQKELFNEWYEVAKPGFKKNAKLKWMLPSHSEMAQKIIDKVLYKIKQVEDKEFIDKLGSDD